MTLKNNINNLDGFSNHPGSRVVQLISQGGQGGPGGSGGPSSPGVLGGQGWSGWSGMNKKPGQCQNPSGHEFNLDRQFKHFLICWTEIQVTECRKTCLSSPELTENCLLIDKINLAGFSLVDKNRRNQGGPGDQVGQNCQRVVKENTGFMWSKP